MNKEQAEKKFYKRLKDLKEKYNSKQRSNFREKKKIKRIQNTSRRENRV